MSVTQDNALISASYQLSLNEKRVLMIAISKVNPLSKGWLESGEITIYAQELTDTFNIDQTNSYKCLRDSLNSLWTRTVWIHGDSKSGKKIRWLSCQEYAEGEGYITINFGREMIHYLTGMVDFFTSYKLLATSGFRSVYTIRLYELCSQFVKTGCRVITVHELRDCLGLNNEYARWGELRYWVLNKAVNEINEKSDIAVRFEVVKKGRGIHAVKFLIDRNTQYVLPL